MPLFLVDHLEGCTPLEPCKSCLAASFLKSKLSDADFKELVAIIGPTSSEPIIPISDEALIDELNLFTLARRALVKNNIATIGDLTAKTESELRRIPYFGDKAVRDTIAALARRGRKLK